jgi:hypothetical protein
MIPTDQESTTLSYPRWSAVCMTTSGARYCGVPTIDVSMVSALTMISLLDGKDVPILASPKSATFIILGASGVSLVRRIFLHQYSQGILAPYLWFQIPVSNTSFVLLSAESGAHKLTV